MPLVCKRAKIMSEAYLTAARSGSASPEEIANRRKAIHNFIRARIADAATVDGGTLSQGFVKSGRMDVSDRPEFDCGSLQECQKVCDLKLE
jgi:hypothetical protein